MLLSVVIPVYNEKDTLFEIVRRVLDSPVDMERELLLIDDCSTDGTRDLYAHLEQKFPNARIRLLKHPVNRGKGAALRTGFAEARGDIILVQDADLEYDPADYPRLVKPIVDGKADGRLRLAFRRRRCPPRALLLALGRHRFLTLLSNMLTNLNLTDMETCYKVFRADVIKSLKLRCNRFGIEPEVTAKIARGNWRIYEVGISYAGRSYDEGKKITWRDGCKAVFAIVRFALAD